MGDLLSTEVKMTHPKKRTHTRAGGGGGAERLYNQGPYGCTANWAVTLSYITQVSRHSAASWTPNTQQPGQERTEQQLLSVCLFPGCSGGGVAAELRLARRSLTLRLFGSHTLPMRNRREPGSVLVPPGCGWRNLVLLQVSTAAAAAAAVSFVLRANQVAAPV